MDVLPIFVVCVMLSYLFIRTTESEKNEIVLLLIERFGTFPSFTAT